MKHSSRVNNTFERRVAVQLLKLLGQKHASAGNSGQTEKKGRVMYAVLGNLLNTDDDGADEVEIRAQCIRFCESKKEAENCDLGDDFADAETEMYNLEDEDERTNFYQAITPQADYSTFLTPGEPAEDVEGEEE